MNTGDIMFFNNSEVYIPWTIKDKYNVIHSENKKGLSDGILTIGQRLYY